MDFCTLPTVVKTRLEVTTADPALALAKSGSPLLWPILHERYWQINSRSSLSTSKCYEFLVPIPTSKLRLDLPRMDSYKQPARIQLDWFGTDQWTGLTDFLTYALYRLQNACF